MYKKSRHSCYDLNYHLVLVTKYRHKVIIRQKYKEELSKFYWKPYFWSNSYFIGCISEISQVVVKEYIKNQKK